MTPAELLLWLARTPPRERDAAIEAHLGIGANAIDSSPIDEHQIGYHPSGVAPIVHALAEVPVTPDDVFIDLGAGLGKVVLLAGLLTGAHARGIELQVPLVERARAAAERLALDVELIAADAREADIADGTVFFLYAPFSGPVLRAVLKRLRSLASERTIVVCTLGLDLERIEWLARRNVDAFWLSIYDSVVPGAAARIRGGGAVAADAAVRAIVRETVFEEAGR